MRKNRKGKMILVIPDCQVKPGINFDWLTATGNLIVEKRPDIVVCLGDFGDFPSLSSYDKGTKSFEGRRVKKDIEAVHEGMKALLAPLRALNRRETVYQPRMIMTLGNHEERVLRAANENSELEGLLPDMAELYRAYGWETYPFLETVVVEGVVFSHYLTSGVMGRPITTAQAILNKKHMSAVVGHQQGRMIADTQRADGSRIFAIITGSYYEHSEGYLGIQGNRHWRGMVILHDTKNGEAIEQFLTIDHVKEKYL